MEKERGRYGRRKRGRRGRIVRRRKRGKGEGKDCIRKNGGRIEKDCEK